MSNQILHAQVVCEPKLQAAFSAIQHAAVVIENDTGPILGHRVRDTMRDAVWLTDIRWTHPRQTNTRCKPSVAPEN